MVITRSSESKPIEYVQKKYSHFTRKYKDLESLKNSSWRGGEYACIMVGSDQVWNYKYLYADSVFMKPLNSIVPFYNIAQSQARLKRLRDLSTDWLRKALTEN